MTGVTPKIAAERESRDNTIITNTPRAGESAEQTAGRLTRRGWRKPSRLFQFFLRIAVSRPPDFLIGGSEQPYMRRWWVIPRNRFFNVYLHHFLRSDDDRALHDHPWGNVSILLDGKYTEHTIAAGGVNRKREYAVGAVKFRAATYAHRVELTDGPCWSLFITGPIIRTWGFHCPAGWRPWKEFVDDRDNGKIGKGCE